MIAIIGRIAYFHLDNKIIKIDNTMTNNISDALAHSGRLITVPLMIVSRTEA